MKLSYTYILSNRSRNMTYVGVTTQLITRITQHKEGKGSVFTNKYNLKDLVYFEEFTDIFQAIAREKQLKNWRKEWKWNLIRASNPELRDLFDDLR